MIDSELLGILACPVCKTGVEYDKKNKKIICKKCRRKYPVENDIPAMLVEKAEV